MSFQTALTDDASWKLEIMETPGMFQIIDVHQSWTGPCKAIQSTFKKIFFEHGDKPIKFFTADASKIDAAKDYVGSCEPVFLFYKDGKKKEVRGVDAPTIVKMIYDGLGVDPNAAAAE
ncbi:flagellar outer dynein arm light chain 6 [Micromonas pusilla CCMP1545]|uniref:Flagellar outer dynein arm light chain 6 n=2 Tax=Micromonas pusilla TaxID=38833 RepID=C1N1K0_MICPC|nr:flagellar outer dynein arm light chain 6 [Micromonas pusilla CCMP1545]EEH54201.1 flagellar outer dynein arm light chain 6 [Micromonas pusilla CCMP1545]|eukprot:XP_003061571.1 flagellar outer dynein arm light chain 6 [Micromonas pusilla CCMP1545]